MTRPRLSVMRPMKEFDPDRRSLVHDQANRLGFEWSADEAERYRQCAKEMPDGMVHFDGRILDGWVPLPKLN